MNQKNLNLLASPFRNPLCVALDVDTDQEALNLVKKLADIVGGFKLGPRLCLRYGEKLTQEIAQHAPVFVDNKHFDIPSTMEAAVRTSFSSGASLVTVHALSGMEALQLMAKVEHELNQIRPFKILAVTVLTSWDQKSLPENLKPMNIDEHVQSLAQLVQQSGLSSIVCSSHELNLFKNQSLFKVTPGIRFPSDDSGDQKRIMGPKQAIENGAQLLVVGRPIIAAKNPRESAFEYLKAIGEADL